MKKGNQQPSLNFCHPVVLSNLAQNLGFVMRIGVSEERKLVAEKGSWTSRVDDQWEPGDTEDLEAYLLHSKLTRWVSLVPI